MFQFLVFNLTIEYIVKHTLHYDKNKIIFSAGEVQHAQVKVFDLISFVISICVYSIIVFFYVDKMFADFVNVQTLYNFLSNFIVFDLFNRHRLIDIVNEFCAFDRYVSMKLK